MNDELYELTLEIESLRGKISGIKEYNQYILDCARQQFIDDLNDLADASKHYYKTGLGIIENYNKELDELIQKKNKLQ